MRSNQLLVPGRYMPQGDVEFGVDYETIGLILKSFFNRWTTEGTIDSATTALDSGSSVGATSISVDDETGFAVGDKIQIGSASQDPEVAEIDSMDGGVTSPYTWSLAESLQKNHDSGNDVTEVTSPFVHKFRVLNSVTDPLPSVSLKVGRDLLEHEFRGAVFDALSFTSEGDFVRCTASIKAQRDVPITVDTNPQSFPSEFAHWSHQNSVRFVTTTEELKSFGLRLGLVLSNNIPEDRAFRFGSRFPAKFTPGPFDVTGTITLAFETTAEYARFWGSSSGPDESSMTREQFAIEFTRDSDTHLHFNFPQVFLVNAPVSMSGRDLLTQELSFEGLYSGAAGWDTPVIVELKNDIARY